MKRIFSYISTLLIFGFLFFNAYRNWDSISSVNWQFGFLRAVVVLVLIVLIQFANIIAWHLIMKSLGMKLDFKKNSKIWVLSNLSRLLPGVIWQYVSRVFLLSKEGVSKTRSLTAMAIEGFLNISIGSIIAIIVIFFWGLPVQKTVLSVILLFILAFGVAVLFFADGRLASKILNFLLEASGKKIRVDLKVIDKKYFPFLILSFVLHFVVPGILLFTITTSVMNLSFSQIPFFIGIFTISWLLGYISLIAPGGIGILEAGTASFLSLYTPFAVGIIIALLFRMALILSEALWVVLVLLFFKT